MFPASAWTLAIPAWFHIPVQFRPTIAPNPFLLKFKNNINGTGRTNQEPTTEESPNETFLSSTRTHSAFHIWIIPTWSPSPTTTHEHAPFVCHLNIPMSLAWTHTCPWHNLTVGNCNLPTPHPRWHRAHLLFVCWVYHFFCIRSQRPIALFTVRGPHGPVIWRCIIISISLRYYGTGRWRLKPANESGSTT